VPVWLQIVSAVIPILLGAIALLHQEARGKTGTVLPSCQVAAVGRAGFHAGCAVRSDAARCASVSDDSAEALLAGIGPDFAQCTTHPIAVLGCRELALDMVARRRGLGNNIIQ
jgi:hypothetical protein